MEEDEEFDLSGKTEDSFEEQKTDGDFLSDLHVNADGQAMAKSNRYNSAFDACDKYRPYLYDPFERFKYYRK